MPRARGSSMGRALLASLALCAAGWGAVQTEAIWWPLVSDEIGAVMAAVERASSGDGRHDNDPEQTTANVNPATTNPVLPPEPITTRDLADAPRVEAGVAVAGASQAADTKSPTVANAAAGGPEAESAAPAARVEGAEVMNASTPNDAQDQSGGMSSAPAATQAEVIPLPPPKIDPANPFQKRALAVGLHPELSRVLLSRLSDADYRNAGIAIGKAVAEAADDDNFVWPRQRQPKLALFQVHFVAGAAPDCRRYVVVVTKDGWSTTAQPMERCGIKRVSRRSS